MRKLYEHTDIIKAWADGAEIQYWCPFAKEWKDIQNPRWGAPWEYRIKPQPSATLEK